MDYAGKRKAFVDWLRRCLMGPGAQGDLLIGTTPTDRFPVGVLFPVIKGEESGEEIAEEIAEEGDDSLASEGEGADKDGVQPTGKKRRFIPPSSVGFSFFIQGDPIVLQVQAVAVRYTSNEDRGEAGRFVPREWRREEISGKDGETKNLRAPPERISTSERHVVLDGNAEIFSLWRPFATGWIVTVSLCNTTEVAVDHPIGWRQAQNERSLFETQLECVIDSGTVGNYPRVDKALLTEEEQELELQYKGRHVYAVGHGAAADWKRDPEGRVTKIFADFMPTVEVPQVTADVESADGDILKMEYLAKCHGGANRIFDGLDRFVTTYDGWVSEQRTGAGNLAEDDYERRAAERIVGRMQTNLSRMRQGVNRLRNAPLAARSFGVANRAMLDQMEQYDRGKGREKAPDRYRWRPFQLAFLLMVIESVIDEDSEFRDTVDLIWFPTGGGKTEAYLGLIAFQIVWRRLTNPASGGGTTVIMRYTLRLLTTQQFLRATRLICALELIRREDPELGREPITAGLWAGEAVSPNSCDSARKIVAQTVWETGESPRKLVLDACPWCLTPFKAPLNYLAEPSRFNFRCTDPGCEFGRADGGIIPFNVVDEALYKDPPSLLISTIDKFARLAWEERSTVFFGKNGNRPPELIIQDELHLIAGALGSVAGLYEAALDTVLTGRGIHAKYIASTATIRMAEDQVRRLYGRTVNVFPPPGLSCDDSFFARTVPTHVRPGRLYVGYLSFMLGRLRCMAPLAAALLAAPEIVFEEGQLDRDLWLEAWWTQVVYHGSLKGVGNSHNAFNIDVPVFFNRLVGEAKPAVKRPPARIAQITSFSTAEENARTFSNLEQPKGESRCLDAVLATNMISVGLDVARLSLMIINGQPLTTAEYIQASSRVGRGEVPGVIFANYYRDQARSLSHYENFRPYHESFYRFVEPTSTTPYTYQARLRALHAALVISIRHAGISLLANRAAGAFDPSEDRVRAVVDILKSRCRRADEDRGQETIAHIDRLIGEWCTEQERCREAGIQLDYQAPDRDKVTDRLLYNHDDKIKGLWPTLQSMRHVEKMALLRQL